MSKLSRFCRKLSYTNVRTLRAGLGAVQLYDRLSPILRHGEVSLCLYCLYTSWLVFFIMFDDKHAVKTQNTCPT